VKESTYSSNIKLIERLNWKTDVDIEFGKVGLKRIINFQYNVGDCLFDVITYLSKYSISFRMIWNNCMSHLKQSLRLGTPKVLKYHRWELKFEFLHDLHHGNANDE